MFSQVYHKEGEAQRAGFCPRRRRECVPRPHVNPLSSSSACCLVPCPTSGPWNHFCWGLSGLTRHPLVRAAQDWPGQASGAVGFLVGVENKQQDEEEEPSLFGCILATGFAVGLLCHFQAP